MSFGPDEKKKRILRQLNGIWIALKKKKKAKKKGKK